MIHKCTQGPKANATLYKAFNNGHLIQKCWTEVACEMVMAAVVARMIVLWLSGGGSVCVCVCSVSITASSLHSVEKH